MRTRSTVLILGAGASRCFGLPLGTDLKSIISRDLNIKYDDFGSRLMSGSYEIVQAIDQILRTRGENRVDINPHRQAAVRISDSMDLSGSIDDYVERHKDDERCLDCAKLAIAKAILESERDSNIFFDPHRNSDQLSGDSTNNWLAHILRDVTRGLTKFDLRSAFENLSIINFNYDRCVEHYCYTWLKQIYSLTSEEAAAAMGGIYIYHPYGKLADLPFENPNSHIAFGGKVDAYRLAAMHSRIRTYSEATTDLESLQIAKEKLVHAKQVAFLGFHFHQQNMNLLDVSEYGPRSSLRSYATLFDVPAPRIDLIRKRISRMFGVVDSRGMFLESVAGTCEQFWNDLGEVLTD